MVKDVIRPLPPMAKLDWQRVADAWNFAAEAAEKPPLIWQWERERWRRLSVTPPCSTARSNVRPSSALDGGLYFVRAFAALHLALHRRRLRVLEKCPCFKHCRHYPYPAPAVPI